LSADQAREAHAEHTDRAPSFLEDEDEEPELRDERIASGGFFLGRLRSRTSDPERCSS